MFRRSLMKISCFMTQRLSKKHAEVSRYEAVRQTEVRSLTSGTPSQADGTIDLRFYQRGGRITQPRRSKRQLVKKSTATKISAINERI
jgi:UDP-glucose 6-dehydrogenase